MTQGRLKALPCAEMSRTSGNLPREREQLPKAVEGHSPPCLPFAALSSQHKQTSPTFMVKLVKSYSSASPALSFKRKKNTTRRSLSLPWRGRSLWHHFTPPGLWALVGPRPSHTPLVIKNFHFPRQVSPTCCSFVGVGAPCPGVGSLFDKAMEVSRDGPELVSCKREGGAVQISVKQSLFFLLSASRRVLTREGKSSHRLC